MARLLFNFAKRSGGSPIPKIPIIIKYKGNELKTTALIDTGADTSFVPEDVAGILGIKYHRSKEYIVTGIDKELRCTRHKVEIELSDGSDRIVIPNVPVDIPKFSQKMVGVLLGRDGFLDKFELTFNQKKDIIVLDYHQS